MTPMPSRAVIVKTSWTFVASINFYPPSWKLILRCQTRVLSGLSMAVTKNEKSPDQFILETSLSEKLSSKYQVNTTAAVQHRNVLFWLENKVLYEKSIFVCCWENLAFIQNVFDTNLQWMNRIQTFMFNPTILNSWMEMLNLFHDIDQRIGLFWLPSIWSSSTNHGWWIINISFSPSSPSSLFYFQKKYYFLLLSQQ